MDKGRAASLWAQILADLRERLHAGEFAERFPTDRELQACYGVSRHTVREAVRHLDADGLLVRRRGRAGTRVRPVEFEQPVGTLYSLFRWIEGQGVAQTSVVRVNAIRRDPEAARRLQLPPATPLLHLERLRLAGGTPLAIDRAWLPADLAAPLLEADLSRTALYDQLQQRCGVHPDAGREQIQPARPRLTERRLLGLGPREVAFVIDRLTSWRGRRVEWRQSLVRGDRYAFVVEWPGTVSGAAPRLEAVGRSGPRSPVGPAGS